MPRLVQPRLKKPSSSSSTFVSIGHGHQLKLLPAILHVGVTFTLFFTSCIEILLNVGVESSGNSSQPIPIAPHMYTPISGLLRHRVLVLALSEFLEPLLYCFGGVAVLL
jgi:hypothetical protein